MPETVSDSLCLHPAPHLLHAAVRCCLRRFEAVSACTGTQPLSRRALLLSTLLQVGMVESFNISVAAALVMYEAQQQRLRRLGRHADLDERQREALKAVMLAKTVVRKRGVGRQTQSATRRKGGGRRSRLGRVWDGLGSMAAWVPTVRRKAGQGRCEGLAHWQRSAARHWRKTITLLDLGKAVVTGTQSAALRSVLWCGLTLNVNSTWGSSGGWCCTG